MRALQRRMAMARFEEAVEVVVSETDLQDLAGSSLSDWADVDQDTGRTALAAGRMEVDHIAAGLNAHILVGAASIGPTVSRNPS